jgi:hypothetical protein
MSVRVRKPIKKFDALVPSINLVDEVNAEIRVPKKKKNEDRITESSDAGTAR